MNKQYGKGWLANCMAVLCLVPGAYNASKLTRLIKKEKKKKTEKLMKNTYRGEGGLNDHVFFPNRSKSLYTRLS